MPSRAQIMLMAVGFIKKPVENVMSVSSDCQFVDFMCHLRAVIAIVTVSAREMSRFIAAGRLHCKIDKVGGIVETTRPDSKNWQYQAS